MYYSYLDEQKLKLKLFYLFSALSSHISLIVLVSYGDTKVLFPFLLLSFFELVESHDTTTETCNVLCL